ncbi:S1/P1 nuclease [Sinomicrobium weinanense]|uniref:S1/P1 nuclease n=1 Tax=Sinomicrobium weinanense TaxID=2842200 RepID=A0A926JVU8_9FLAO|nr:S1/P1 nuclease [Sinomicrobium weinanense]MBC9798523.1 S1/P1 nuclease [Sinomicrobium weinanense]MBU3125786.1 S1/P1 nuclease [Sinomicrobium weinanense]
MKKAVFLLVLFIGNMTWANSVVWGPTGHRVVGEIAEQYLSGRARRKIDKLLHGESLAVVANHGDDIKSDNRFRKYGAWHYVNIPPGKRYGEEAVSEYGDLVTGIEKCIEIIKDKNAPEEDRAFYLKLLIHFIGDLHQPLHVGRAEDKGGNDIQVRWFNDGTNLHSVWDSKMINHYRMSYTEIAGSYPGMSRKEVKKLQEGNLLDWVGESRKLAGEVYASAEIGEKLGYRYMYDHFGTVKAQLQKGGLRLAKVLNEIFG